MLRMPLWQIQFEWLRVRFQQVYWCSKPWGSWFTTWCLCRGSPEFKCNRLGGKKHPLGFVFEEFFQHLDLELLLVILVVPFTICNQFVKLPILLFASNLCFVIWVNNALETSCRCSRVLELRRWKPFPVTWDLLVSSIFPWFSCLSWGN